MSEAVRLLEDKGFVCVDQVSVLGKGDKIYKTVKGKGLVAAIIGEEPMEKGLNILGAHVDSPRIDLKPAPVYEEAEMVFFKTHYYEMCIRDSFSGDGNVTNLGIHSFMLSQLK